MKPIAVHKKIIKISFFVIPALIIFFYLVAQTRPYDVIKVGILHSRTGSLALSEEPLVDAVILAIEKINAAGGLLGKKLMPIVADGKSDEQTFAALAEKLITEDKVAVIFGCWSSSTRKAVKPVVEKFNSLLFYPVQYEGVESSPNIVYTGGSLNQHLLPSLAWAMNNLGKSFFLVGVDYIYSHVAHTIIKDVIINLGGTVVGEEYFPLGSQDVGSVLDDIEKKKPQVILSTISGDTNIGFFKDLTVRFNKKIPVMSSSISEAEVEAIGVKNVAGTYQTRNYFESVQTEASKNFIENMKNKYGKHTSVTGPMEAAYFGVHLWSEAVKKAQNVGVEKVLEQLYTITYLAPQGMVKVDKDNNHTWQVVRVGKVQESGEFEIVWESQNPIKPEPYPSDWFITDFFKENVRKTRQDWDNMVLGFYTAWGNKWTRAG